jgi:FkbM family methyltransferase
MNLKLSRFARITITRILGDRNKHVLLPVMRGPARGLRFRLNLQLPIELAYFLGTYESQITQELPGICKRGWTVWDCGTYLGYYTCLFARLVGPEGQVIAVEPDPRNMARTKDNVARNGFNNVSFVRAAIGAPVGYTEFVINSDTNSHIPGTYIGATPGDYTGDTRRQQQIRVRALSLDEMVDQIAMPHLIKLDIEGAEQLALEHSLKLVEKARPIILLELHNPSCDTAAWQFAGRANYMLKALPGGQLLQRAEEVHGTVLALPRSRGDRFESID